MAGDEAFGWKPVVSPRKEDVRTPAPVKGGDSSEANSSEANFSYYEMTADIHGKLGKLDKAVEILSDQFREHERNLREDFKERDRKIDDLIKTVHEAKGSVKTLVWIFSAFLGLATLLLALSNKFTFHAG